MARPEKLPEELHSAMVAVRYTEAEHEQLKALAQPLGITVSEFVRRTTLGVKLPPLSSDQEQRAAIHSALIRLGVNLNQIARVANIRDKVLVNMLYELLVRINETMDKLDESY